MIMIMYKVGFITCSKDKLPHSAPAKDMYTSWVFNARRTLVERTCDAWYIISAKGLLHPDTIIEPYDDWLKDAPAARRRQVQFEIAQAIIKLHPHPTHALLYVGAHYHSPILATTLKQAGIDVQIPHLGMSVCRTRNALNRELEALS